MKRVLFVDDEINILSALKRTLRTMRREWDMTFIADPKHALEEIKRNPFDVVVSDMKMPVMDGADFLKEVRKLHPESIRIILSGHAHLDMIMKSVGPTHQYLAKPCDPEDLVGAIQRAISLKQLINSEPLRHLVAGLGTLPSMPSAYDEILRCLQDSQTSLSDIERIIEKDVGMTAKILQLVNSAFFGVAGSVSSIERAVSLLGLDTIGSLVLAHGIFEEYKDNRAVGFDVDILWAYSARSAGIAREVAKLEKLESKAIDEATLASMLHDVGKLVLVAERPEEYSRVLQQTGGQSCFADDAECEIFGATHGQVGAYLVGLWGLPDSIVEAIAYHETPADCSVEEFGVLGVVHVASKLAQCAADLDPAEPSLRLDLEYLRRAGVADRWSQWRAAAQTKLGQGEYAA